MDVGQLIKRRNSQIILALSLWFCVGCLSGESPDPYLIILVNIGLAVTTTLLLITLSQLKNRPIIRSFHWIMYMTWPIAFPGYWNFTDQHNCRFRCSVCRVLPCILNEQTRIVPTSAWSLRWPTHNFHAYRTRQRSSHQTLEK